MDGLLFYYRDREGRRGQIKVGSPQYIFMEPYDKVVLRYSFKKNGIDTEDTNITRQVVDPNYLSVKVRPTSDPFLSKISDFDSITMEDVDSFPIDFKGSEELYVDVLYESKTARRLKVKVSTIIEENESFENENTISDGPDEYVRMSDVQIKYDAVYFNYIFRRSGRLKKYAGAAPYSVLGSIYKDRQLNAATHVDKNYPRASVTEYLRSNGWFIDPNDQMIYKTDSGRKIEITEEELGNIVRDTATPLEILGLLRTTDIGVSNHPLRKQAEMFLQDCDRVCNLPDADITTVIDNRG